MAKKSLEEVHHSVDTLQKKGFFGKLLAFMGPAYLISVGYMDPGNWATDLAGGSGFGYTLLWVLLMSNIMAVLLQSLSARLGIVSGRDLAQAGREVYPPAVNFSLYLLAEIAIIATDLAEVIGMAIGLNLLFNIPLIWGILITFLDTFILLFLINKGMRKMEAFILALISIIGISFFVEMLIARPEMTEVIKGLIPGLPNHEALYIALGIIGATVMPHNLYLHSSLVQTRKFGNNHKSIKEAIRFNFIDSAIALNLAFFVNAAILILAAATFYKAGMFEVAEIQDAYRLLEPLLGNGLAPVLFAIALIAAGQSSTITGTLAGQIIMEGFINFRMQAWVRRMITRLFAIVPAILVIYYLGASYTGKMLIFSQVVLSLQLGFAVIPLIHFVSDKKRMGVFAIGSGTKIFSWLVAGIIIVLNAWLVIKEIQNLWAQSLSVLSVIFVGLFLIFIVGLLIYITLHPFIGNKQMRKLAVHHNEDIEPVLEKPEYRRIVISLDFSSIDQEVLRHGLALGSTQTEYLLVHVVESIPAHYHGLDSGDYESVKDKEVLEKYALRISRFGYTVHTKIGYGNPKNVIPELTNNFEADVLVLGSHGHKFLMDIVLGTTINSVRHKLQIPVFVVK